MLETKERMKAEEAVSKKQKALDSSNHDYELAFDARQKAEDQLARKGKELSEVRA